MTYLKKRKLFEGNQVKLDGMQLRLQEQLFAIEAATDANQTLETLTMASEASKQAIIESGQNYEDFKETLEEQKAQREQLDSLFADSGVAGDDADDLAAELDKLVIEDQNEGEQRNRDQLEANDAVKLDAELAMWEEKINAFEVKGVDPFRTQDEFAKADPMQQQLA